MKTKLMALEALKLATPQNGMFDEERAKCIAAIAAIEADIAKPVDNSEQSAFEDWLTRTNTSGDVESVQRQWIASGDYADLYTTPQEPSAAGWMPIETAPKDGTEFLMVAVLDGDSDYAVCRWCNDDVFIGWVWDDVHEFYNPTGWMPLPAAPGGAA